MDPPLSFHDSTRVIRGERCKNVCKLLLVCAGTVVLEEVEGTCQSHICVGLGCGSVGACTYVLCRLLLVYVRTSSQLPDDLNIPFHSN